MIDGLTGPDLRPLNYPQLVADLRDQDFHRLGHEYATRIAALAPGKQRVVDKMPANFLYVGLIHLMLPNARIIHCRRDPVDTCFSCYSKLFAGEQKFSYDLREAGLFQRGEQRLTEAWRSLLPPDRFLDIDYEEVVADLETQARRLLSFCDLPWESNCLAFHQNKRPVRTASVTQVRQPIYSASVGRWKPYADYLAPLLAALEGPLEDRPDEAP